MKLLEFCFRLSTAAALAAGPALAERSTKLSVGMRLYGTGTESLQAQSRLAGTELEAGLQHVFSSTTRLDFSAGLLAETGSSRALYVDEFRPRQQLRVREGNFAWAPIPEIELRAGSLDQDRWAQPLLLSGQSFPSLSQQIRLPLGHWNFSLAAEQAFATDSTNLLGGEKFPQGPATFYFERASVEYLVRDQFRAEAHASHFRFDNLSVAAAHPSRFSGNTVRGTGPANSAFAFAYHGFEAGGALGAHLTSYLEPSVSASVLRNSGAPTRNLAARAEARLALRSGTTRVTPSFEVFRIEADAAPAAFNDRALGHANRQGYGVGLAVSWDDDSVETAARFVDARALSATTYQSDLKWFQLSLRTRYDVL